MSKEFGTRLRALRRHAGLTATQLAADGLSVATVSRLEHGSIDPSLTTLTYLASRLGCPPAQLLQDAAADLTATLAQADAWLLLDRPLSAHQVLQGAQALALVDGLLPGSPALTRLRWSLLRTEAALDPARARPRLRDALQEATAANDPWATLRLRLALGSLPITPATAIPVLLPLASDQAATTWTSPPDAVLVAQALLVLAQLHEVTEAHETARSFYQQAAHAAQPLAQPHHMAVSLLEQPLASVDALPAPLALAVCAAAQRIGQLATLGLVQHDLRDHRPAAAAHRLQQLASAGTASAIPAALHTSFLEAVAASAGPHTFVTCLAGLPFAPDALAQAQLSLASADIALLAGRLDEAERLVAPTAVAFAAEHPQAAQRLWHVLALAWASAGHAPRAAAVLRRG
jgi:transcriptional regulator with XRE-family HTH domain